MFSIVFPIFASADQIWDHEFTPVANLVNTKEAPMGCPTTILIEANDDNEIHFLGSGYLLGINAYGIVDGRSRSINGHKTSFERTEEGLVVEEISGSLVYGSGDTHKVIFTLGKGSKPGTFVGNIQHWRKAHFFEFFHLSEEFDCAYKTK